MLSLGKIEIGVVHSQRKKDSLALRNLSQNSSRKNLEPGNPAHQNLSPYVIFLRVDAQEEVFCELFDCICQKQRMTFKSCRYTSFFLYMAVIMGEPIVA